MPSKGLSFCKGGRWEQFPNAPQILPFNANDEHHSSATNQLDLVHLASFSLTNFQSKGGTSGKGALGISSYLLLEITTSNNITLCMFGCTMLPSSLDLASLLEENCNVMF